VRFRCAASGGIWQRDYNTEIPFEKQDHLLSTIRVDDQVLPFQELDVNGAGSFN
jgi:hypothetical protein